MSVNRLCRWIPVATVLLLLVAVTPAAARGTLDKERVPADTDVELVVQATVDEPGVFHERVVVEVPDGFTVRPCVPPPEGFRCFLRPAASPPRTLVIWERTEDPDVTVPFSTDELPFRTRSHPKPGRYRFVITQLYSNGEESRSDGPPESANPAPVLEVTPSATTTSTTASPPGSSSTTSTPDSVSSTSAPSIPSTTVPPPAEPPPIAGPDGATTTTIRAAIDVVDSGGDDEDGPGWVLALTGAALVGGAGALAARAAGRRRLIDVD